MPANSQIRQLQNPSKTTDIYPLTVEEAVFDDDGVQLPSKLTQLYGDIADVEATTTATRAYSVGDYVVCKGQLYKATASIAIGGTITPNTNVTAVKITDEMGNLADLETPEKSNLVASINSAQEQLNDHTGVLGAKNLVPNNAKTNTVNGVTFTVNANGTITASTDSSGSTAPYTQSQNGNYPSFIAPFTGIVLLTGGISSNEHIYPWDATRNARPYTDASKTTLQTNNQYDANGALPFYIEQGNKYAVCCRISERGTVLTTPITFKPMIRLASDPDDTYVPYAMTNRELTENRYDLPILSEMAITTDTALYNAVISKKNVGNLLILFDATKTMALLSAMDSTYAWLILVSSPISWDLHPEFIAFTSIKLYTGQFNLTNGGLTIVNLKEYSGTQIIS